MLVEWQQGFAICEEYWVLSELQRGCGIATILGVAGMAMRFFVKNVRCCCSGIATRFLQFLENPILVWNCNKAFTICEECWVLCGIANAYLSFGKSCEECWG